MNGTQYGESNNRKRLKTILYDYDYIEGNPAKVEIFRALTKVHEPKSSSNEFNTLRRFIDSSESNQYVKSQKNNFYYEDCMTSLYFVLYFWH
jgi:hypothetical protein